MDMMDVDPASEEYSPPRPSSPPVSPQDIKQEVPRSPVSDLWTIPAYKEIRCIKVEPLADWETAITAPRVSKPLPPQADQWEIERETFIQNKPAVGGYAGSVGARDLDDFTGLNPGRLVRLSQPAHPSLLTDHRLDAKEIARRWNLNKEHRKNANNNEHQGHLPLKTRRKLEGRDGKSPRHKRKLHPNDPNNSPVSDRILRSHTKKLQENKAREDAQGSAESAWMDVDKPTGLDHLEKSVDLEAEASSGDNNFQAPISQRTQRRQPTGAARRQTKMLARTRIIETSRVDPILPVHKSRGDHKLIAPSVAPMKGVSKQEQVVEMKEYINQAYARGLSDEVLKYQQYVFQFEVRIARDEDKISKKQARELIKESRRPKSWIKLATTDTVQDLVLDFGKLSTNALD